MPRHTACIYTQSLAECADPHACGSLNGMVWTPTAIREGYFVFFPSPEQNQTLTAQQSAYRIHTYTEKTGKRLRVRKVC